MTQINRSSGATHIPLLIRVFNISEGDVLEVGTGYFSTLMLDWLAQISERHVYSYENEPKWYERAKAYENYYHHIVFCKDWHLADFDQKHWGMAFIDHHPAYRRAIEIARLADKADYIVLHDSDQRSNTKGGYHYNDIWSLFKYRYDFKKLWPGTSVVSNFKDLKELGL